MEERVAGEHVLAVRHEPVVELALLVRQRVQLVPDVGAAAGRAQARHPQLGAVAVGDRLELVELADVLAGDDDRELEALEAGVGEVLHRRHRGVVGARAADGVVDLGGRAVERDLHVDVVAGREPRATSASMRLPLVENLTPTWWAVA